MKTSLEDVLDIHWLQHLQDRLHKEYSYPTAVIDQKGKVLTTAGWREICTKFHFKHPECARECILSNDFIARHLDEAVPSLDYRCQQGLINITIPILIQGRHLGSIVSGQVFQEEPDLVFLRERAAFCGFEEQPYLEAVSKVPVWTREQLDQLRGFMEGFAGLLREIVQQNLEANRIRTENGEKEQLPADFTKSSPLIILEWDRGMKIRRWTGAAEQILGWTESEMVGRSMESPGLIHPEDMQIALDTMADLSKNMHGRGVCTFRFVARDGRFITCEWYVSARLNKNGELLSVLALGVDTSRKVAAREELLQINESFNKLNQVAIHLSSLSPGDDLERIIAEDARSIFGAVAATFARYDADKKVLKIRNIAARKRVITAATRLIGRRIEELESKVSEKDYGLMTSELIGFTTSLKRASFDAIPGPVSRQVKALLGVDRFIALAYILEDKLYGTSLLAMEKGKPDPPLEVLSSFRGLASVSLRRQQAEREILKMKESLELLNKRFVDLREKEMTEASMELHFQLVQSLTAIIMDVKWLQKKAGGNPEMAGKLEAMLAQLSEMTRNIQALSTSLHPSMLGEIGLSSTIETYCNEFQARSGILCQKDIDPVEPEDLKLGLSLYRVLQEALTNVLHHSGATRVKVALKQKGAQCTLTIKDNGKGISKQKIESIHSLGLIEMRERVKSFRGRLEINSNPGKGTTIHLKIPCPDDTPGISMDRREQ